MFGTKIEENQTVVMEILLPHGCGEQPHFKG
jgi:hypothetical protein